MRGTTIAAGVTAAVIAGAALAVPALADTTSTATTSTTAASSTSTAAAATGGLTDAQQQELDDFLAAHPKVAQGLVKRIERWKAFADAHPALVAELKKVAALPQDQRRAELKAWLKAHPDDAKALHALRQQVRSERREHRQARRERRQDRRQGTATPDSTSSPTTTSSSTSTTT